MEDFLPFSIERCGRTKDGRYLNSPLSDEYLVPDKPNHVGGLVTMFDRRLYAGWDKLTQAIRTNRPTTWDPDRERSLFDSADPEMLATFWEAMHAMSTLTGRALGEAFDAGGFRRLLDVGGGSAAFDIVLCQRYPELHATVYDLEFVADIAARNVNDAGLGDRITATPGDFFADATFPAGHDLHLFSMIMHDWDEERDQVLLRKSFDALEPGGRGLVSVWAQITEPGDLGASITGYGGLNYIVNSADHRAAMAAHGFDDPRRCRSDAAQMAKEVEGGPLGQQQRAHRANRFGHHRAGRDLRTILGAQMNLNSVIDEIENTLE